VALDGVSFTVADGQMFGFVGPAAAVPGAEVVEDGGPRGTLLALRDGTPPDRVLDAARAAGRVTHFSLERPTLAELFRVVVAEDAQAAA